MSAAPDETPLDQRPPDETPDASTRGLEEKIAFVERHVEQIDGLVRDLFEEVAGLRREVMRLREDVGRRFQDLERQPDDDVPPHWGGRT